MTTTDRTVVLPFPLRTNEPPSSYIPSTQCYNSQELSKSINTSQEKIKSITHLNLENVISYEGIVTKYIADSIIELDNETNVYLIHYLCPDEGRGLRIGAKIRLDNVHLVFFSKTFKVIVPTMGCN